MNLDDTKKIDPASTLRNCVSALTESDEIIRTLIEKCRLRTAERDQNAYALDQAKKRIAELEGEKEQK